MIHFENVGLRYGMGPEILRDLTFDIPKKSFQFLTGPSGAGKTTLLRLLFMSLQPTRGLIRMFGRDISEIPRPELPLLRRRVGIVFQDFRLLDHLTTYENVALPLRVRGKEENTYKTDVIELLHRAETGDGVKIFIGSENKLFSLSGSSMIAAPLRGGGHRFAGVLGVIGPTRLNYGRIVPMVEYAAQVLGDLKRSR